MDGTIVCERIENDYITSKEVINKCLIICQKKYPWIEMQIREINMNSKLDFASCIN